MSRSPLHGFHEARGARFVDFGGWEMPLQYSSVLEEHRAVREWAGFFDVSHLGRFELAGPGAKVAVRRLLCNDVSRIEPGRAQYTMMLNQSGGVIDDLIVWWWEEDRFWLLPNAANHARVMSSFAAEPRCEIFDLRPTTVMLAVQGPEAPRTITDLLGTAPGRFRLAESAWDGSSVSMAGTGYTGEKGGELCTDPEGGLALAQALVDAGVAPCGLGARDTLRLEAGLPLWGQDLDETTTPLEAGLDFVVSLEHDFVGRDVLVAQSDEGVTRRLTGFVLDGRGIPRHGFPVRTQTGEGVVTSGNISPMLGRGVGLAYLSPPPPAGSDAIEVGIRGTWVQGRIVDPPFHQA